MYASLVSKPMAQSNKHPDGSELWSFWVDAGYVYLPCGRTPPLLLDVIMLPFISLKNVSIDYPILGRSERMLRHTLMNTLLGGKITTGKKLEIRALQQINLDIFPGEVIGLVGPNGSGKSTLLGVLAGVFKPTEGEMIQTRRVISLLTLDMGMLAEATGLENAAIMATIRQIPRRVKKKFIKDVSDISGLNSYMKMPIRTYSSGMRLRLAFAMAISIDTDVIILDEIISVADEEFKNYMLRCITNLTMNKKSLVIASHTKQLIDGLCHRIIHLNNGTLISNERVTPQHSFSESIELMN